MKFAAISLYKVYGNKKRESKKEREHGKLRWAAKINAICSA